MAATILTYHAVETGPRPLCIEPELFREHLDVVVASGARAVTVRQLAAHVRTGLPPEPLVAITFDDGFASVATQAAPLLLARRLPATVYCVAGLLGGTSEWTTARTPGFVGQLAPGPAVAELAANGFEIGSHGFDHSPLVLDDEAVLRRELVLSREILAERTGAAVTTFAMPYGAAPSVAARRLLVACYEAACTTALGYVLPSSDVHALPRVDAHYVRRPERLESLLAGSLGGYLRVRRVGARARRVVRGDYVLPGSHH